ncbi:unnamed protein product [Heligmosomoides polygyrus]|uniref:Transposase n=1 Tax=Heligmosomoides polygyrus TaxID=6339 RepID=A0A183GFS3_HELPZ|nr:unnamed protein product [Heligmosomoides polygyrus]
MEGLLGLDEKSEPGTWYRVHATAGTSSDCAIRRSFSDKAEEGGKFELTSAFGRISQGEGYLSQQREMSVVRDAMNIMLCLAV